MPLGSPASPAQPGEITLAFLTRDAVAMVGRLFKVLLFEWDSGAEPEDEAPNNRLRGRDKEGVRGSVG